MDNDFIGDVEKSFKKVIDYGKGKCCVCHHDLEYHVDEGNFWRCHMLGLDHFQCECILNKGKAENDIKFFDLASRAEEHMKDLREERETIDNVLR